jgi:integrase
LELLYATGCRASEISNMTLRDLHLDEQFCVCRGKGDKERQVPLNSRAVEAVQLYMEQERPALAAKGKLAVDWVLLSRRGRQLPNCIVNAFGSCSNCMRKGWAFRLRSARIRCGTVLQPMCWRAAPTCARCKKCSATPASPRRKSIPMSIRRG